MGNLHLIYSKVELAEIIHQLLLTVRLLIGEEMTPFKRVHQLLVLIKDGPALTIQIGLQVGRTIPLLARMPLPLEMTLSHQDQVICI